MAKNFTWTDQAILSWIEIWAKIWNVKTVLDSHDVKTNLGSWAWQVGDTYIEPGSRELCTEVLTRESDFSTFHIIGAIPLPGLEGVYAIRRECAKEARSGNAFIDEFTGEVVEVVADINLWLADYWSGPPLGADIVQDIIDFG